jgi:DNA-binding MarR family transcriptional regulator
VTTSNGDLVAEVIHLYRALVRSTRAADADEAALTATQRLALTEVADAGPLRLHELAERMATTAPTASRAVDALVQAGLAVRVEDARDRRAVQIDVSRRGRRYVDAHRARVAKVLAPAFAKLAASDRDELVALLERLNGELSAGGLERSGGARSAASSGR